MEMENEVKTSASRIWLMALIIDAFLLLVYLLWRRYKDDQRTVRNKKFE